MKTTFQDWLQAIIIIATVVYAFARLESRIDTANLQLATLTERITKLEIQYEKNNYVGNDSGNGDINRVFVNRSNSHN